LWRFAGDKAAVCLDTAHLFAADMTSRAKSDLTAIETIDRVLGLGKRAGISCERLEDPPAGARDRHEHIGDGKLARRRLSGFCGNRGGSLPPVGLAGGLFAGDALMIPGTTGRMWRSCGKLAGVEGGAEKGFSMMTSAMKKQKKVGERRGRKFASSRTCRR